MPLVRGPNGKLLRGPSGKLASSTNCCCGDVDCPQCCIRILGGVLDAGVISLFDTYDSNNVEIEITTESGTRTVCDGDEITFTFRVLDGSGNPVSAAPRITVDPAWTIVSATPTPTDSLLGTHGGYVVWDEAIRAEYSVLLRFRTCFFYEDSTLGPITLTIDRSGTDYVEVVGVQVCTPSTACCDLAWDCDPCCWAMPKVTTGAGDRVNPEWSWNPSATGGARWERLFNVEGHWLLAWLRPADAMKPTVFCQDDWFVMGLDISSEDPAKIEFITGQVAPNPSPVFITFTIGDFEADMASELPAGATLVAGQVKWTSEDALSYEVPIRHNCDFPGQSALSWGFALDENLNGLIGVDEPQGATEIFLEECEKVIDAEGCLCGCPCCGFCHPDTLVIEWTYDGVDYSVEVDVSGTQCGCPVTWRTAELADRWTITGRPKCYRLAISASL